MNPAKSTATTSGMTLWGTAKYAVMVLHKEIAEHEPEKHLSRLSLLKEIADYDGDLDSLRLTWDLRHTTLLRKEQYEAALLLVNAPPTKRYRCMELYQAAQKQVEREAPAAAHTAPERHYRLQIAQTILERTPHRDSMPELAFIDNESGFMAHLNTLKVRSGKGLRPIAAQMNRIDSKNGRAHATLATLFASDTIPSNENVVYLLLKVLLSNNTTASAPKDLLDDHMRVWRKLIARRTTGDLEPSPLNMAIRLLTMAEERADPQFVPGLQLAQRLIEEALGAVPTDNADAERPLPGGHGNWVSELDQRAR